MSLFTAPSLLELPDAHVTYIAGWASAAEAEEWFRVLETQTPWERPSVTLYGRQHPVPRLTAWYGDPEAVYRYSGIEHCPLAWTPLLADIRARVEAEVGQKMNGLLLNLYRDGQDSMGWHSDDEAVLGRNPVVVSLSLGGERRFDLRRRDRQGATHSLVLGDGSLLVMRGATQHYWQHQVAKTRKPCAPRLNLTFRLLYG
jgi:alkylated DNA repair dioxygenase AlkB